MPYHSRPRDPILSRFLDNRRHSAGVVDVAMGINRGVHPLARVAPDDFECGALIEVGAGVDQHEAFGVLMALTFANHRQNITPSATSSDSPVKASG